MSEQVRVLKVGLHVAILVAVAISPFVLYSAVRQVGSASGNGAWPAPVAVLAVEGRELRGAGVLVFPDADSPVLVLMPPEALLRVPAQGELRANTAYRIGGAGMVAGGISATIGVEVPYAVWGPPERGGSPVNDLRVPLPSEVNGGTLVGEPIEEVGAALAPGAAGARTLGAPGEWTTEGGIRSYHLDRVTLSRWLSGRVPAPEPIPEPTPEPDPEEPVDRAEVIVEVLNAGGPSGSATQTGNLLRGGGFVDVRIGNFAGTPVEGIVVYYIEEPRFAAEVIEALDAAVEPEELPEGLTSTAHVLVLVGRPV